MFKNVGKEIKRCAEFIVLLLTATSVLAGFAVFAVLAENDLMVLGLIAVAAIVGIGYFLHVRWQWGYMHLVKWSIVCAL